MEPLLMSAMSITILRHTHNPTRCIQQRNHQWTENITGLMVAMITAQSIVDQESQ